MAGLPLAAVIAAGLAASAGVGTEGTGYIGVGHNLRSVGLTSSEYKRTGDFIAKVEYEYPLVKFNIKHIYPVIKLTHQSDPMIDDGWGQSMVELGVKFN